MIKISDNYYDFKDQDYPFYIKLPIIIATTILMLIIVMRFFGATVINGDSMYPTLEDGNKLLLDKFSVMFEIKTGAVVSCRYPGDEKTVYAKRVIGTPGDTIEIKNGRVLLNNKDITDKYWNSYKVEQDFDKITVPKDSYFVIGDNINVSMDSRIVGCIKKSDIIGIMIAKI